MTQIDIKRLIYILKNTSEEELKPRFRHVSKSYKDDGSIITEADTAMQNCIQAQLSAIYPSIALLGEEMSVEEQEQALKNPAGVWVLDPIDGTSNFSQGLPYYCVSLALIRNGEVELGLIYDPERDECFYAEKGQGAFLNGQRMNAPDFETPLDQSLAGVDFKRLPADMAARIASQPPYASQRSLGAIALDWCWIASGRIQVYLHGKQKLWDYAAGWLILKEANGASQTVEGACVFTPSMQAKFALAAVSDSMLIEWQKSISQE